jgi:hypothetical protein
MMRMVFHMALVNRVAAEKFTLMTVPSSVAWTAVPLWMKRQKIGQSVNQGQ